jgi:cardiolipin synthase
LWPPNFTLNLRNHRKILVVDGELAFTGGMNIRNKHIAVRGVRPADVIDVHFRLRGPIVTQIEEVFAADWLFSTRQALPPPSSVAPVTMLPEEAECRVIVDGPNEDLDKLLWVLVGAISAARSEHPDHDAVFPAAARARRGAADGRAAWRRGDDRAAGAQQFPCS